MADLDTSRQLQSTITSHPAGSVTFADIMRQDAVQRGGTVAEEADGGQTFGDIMKADAAKRGGSLAVSEPASGGATFGDIIRQDAQARGGTAAETPVYATLMLGKVGEHPSYQCGQAISNALRASGIDISATQLVSNDAYRVQPGADGDFPAGTVLYFPAGGRSKLQHFAVAIGNGRVVENTSEGGNGAYTYRAGRTIAQIAAEHGGVVQGFDPLRARSAPPMPLDQAQDILNGVYQGKKVSPKQWQAAQAAVNAAIGSLEPHGSPMVSGPIPGTDPAEAAGFAAQAGGVRNPGLRESPTTLAETVGRVLDAAAAGDRAFSEKARRWVLSGHPNAATAILGGPLSQPGSKPAAGILADIVAAPAGLYDMGKGIGQTIGSGTDFVASLAAGPSYDDRARYAAESYVGTGSAILHGLLESNPVQAAKAAVAGDPAARAAFVHQWVNDPANAAMDWIMAGGTIKELGEMPVREGMPSLRQIVQSSVRPKVKQLEDRGALPAGTTQDVVAGRPVAALTRPHRPPPTLSTPGTLTVPAAHTLEADVEAAPPMALEPAAAAPAADAAPAAPTLRQDAASKPLYAMSDAELDAAIDHAKGEDAAAYRYAFGDQAQAYRRAQKTADSPYASRQDVEDAIAITNRMEAGLTQDQRDVLDGIKPAPGYENLPHDLDTLRAFRGGLSGFDHADVDGMARDIGYDMMDLAHAPKDPAEMNLRQQIAYTRIGRAFDAAREQGFDINELYSKALSFAAGRYGDPEDARFMLESFMPNRAELPVPPAPSPVRSQSEIEATPAAPRRGRKAAAAAPADEPTGPPPLKQYTDALQATAIDDAEGQARVDELARKIGNPRLTDDLWNRRYGLQPGDAGYRAVPSGAVGPPKPELRDILAGAGLKGSPSSITEPSQRGPEPAAAPPAETTPEPRTPPAGVPQGPLTEQRGISPEEFAAAVDGAGRDGTISVDEYARARGIPPNRASAELTIAELSGVARRAPGGRFAVPEVEPVPPKGRRAKTGSPSPTIAPAGDTPTPTPVRRPRSKSAPAAVSSPARFPAVEGMAGVASTADNRPVSFRWAVMDARDLIASHTPDLSENPAYAPAEMQPRDRTRTASRILVDNIAQNLNPLRLADSAGTWDGAPVVGSDRMVESGNGRVLGIRRAYDTQGAANTRAYRQFVVENAQRFGLDPEAVDAIERPVLVRVRDRMPDESDTDRIDFARTMGHTPVTAMSESETAVADGQMLHGAGLLDRAAPDLAANVTSRTNMDFVRDFVARVPPADAPAMYDASGALSTYGARRIRNAVVAAAYDDANLITRLTESLDNNVRNVGNALVATAVRMAQLRHGIDTAGLVDLDITPSISEAVERMSSLRDRGVSVDDYLAQPQMLSEETPIARALLRFFDQNKRSAKRIGELLDTYAQMAMIAGDRSTGALFDTDPPTRENVLEAARIRVESSYATGNAAQAGLDFGAEDRRPSGAEDSGADGREDEPPSSGGLLAEPQAAYHPEAGNIIPIPEDAGAPELGEGTLHSPDFSATRRLTDRWSPPGQNDGIYRVTQTDKFGRPSPWGENVTVDGPPQPRYITRWEAGTATPEQIRAYLRQQPYHATRFGSADPLDPARYDVIADEAARRIVVRNKGRMGAMVDPADLADAAVWVACKIVKGLVNAKTFGGKVLGALGRHLQGSLPAIWRQGVAIANEFISDEVGGIPTDFIDRATRNFRGGRYRAAYELSKPVGDKLNTLVSSRISALERAHYVSRWVQEGLSADQKDLMMSYLKDLRRRVLVANGWTPGPGLPPMPAADIARVKADPAIQQALARHQVGPQADIESLRTYVSPRMTLTKTEGDHFLSLLPLKDSKGLPVTTGTGPGRSVAAQQRLSPTRFAQEATGSAQEYSHDYEAVLAASYTEVMRKARLKDLYHTLLRERDAAGNPLAVTNALGARIPGQIQFKGQTHRVMIVGTDLLRNPGIGRPYEVKIGIPEPLYASINDATLYNPYMEGGEGHIRAAQGFGVALQLAGPSEMVNHVGRLTELASTLTPNTLTGHLEALVLWIGPRLGTLCRIYNTDMSLPENITVLEQIMDANGGSSRPFDAHIGKGLAAKIPGLAQLSGMGHDFLFGFPHGKGLAGFDLRLRVMAEKLRREVEGDQDPQRIREFANQFGQYTSKPDALIDNLRRTGILSPYLATKLPIQLTEFRRLVGDNGFKGLTRAQRLQLTAECLFRGWAGSILAAQLINYAATGHPTWQNGDNHKFDVAVGHDRDGSTVYVAGTVLAPGFTRAVRTLGLTDDLEDWAGGKLSPSKAALNSMRGTANEGLAVAASPVTSVGFAAATGKGMYVTRGGDLLSLAKRGSTPEEKLRNNLLAALGQTNQFVGPAARAISPAAREAFGDDTSFTGGPLKSKAGLTTQVLLNTLTGRRAVTRQP